MTASRTEARPAAFIDLETRGPLVSLSLTLAPKQGVQMTAVQARKVATDLLAMADEIEEGE